MATHSTAYIPTNRVPGEYIMSEGWSDGMLNDTGLSWYRSIPRMNEAIRATMLLGGSPVFAPAGRTDFEIKEIDFIEEGVCDDLEDADESFTESVAVTLEALEGGDWEIAESTAYGKMTLEEKMAMGITLNTRLHTIKDFSDVPNEYGVAEPPYAYLPAALIEALKQYDPKRPDPYRNSGYTPDVVCFYYYHDTHKQWWGLVTLPDQQWMYLPLVIGFAIEVALAGEDAFEEVKKLHRQYPEHYAKDIAALAEFEAARHV